MFTVSFSLTEKAVIDPILTKRAPLPPLEPFEVQRWTATVWQAIESEVVARVVAVFTSVFAAVDTLVHLLTGVYKGVGLLSRNICCLSYRSSEVYAHFRQAAWFALLTVVGSLAGVVWPGIFKNCRYAPPPPSDYFPDAPPHIQKLAEEIQQEKQQAPFDQLKKVWKDSSLEDRHWFVQVFNHDGTESFRSVRAVLADTVYKPILPLRNRQVKWLSAEEVDHCANRAWIAASIYLCSCFFHATSEPALESILKSKKIEVRHEKLFRGAFVSSKPETGFGRCILALKRTIERLSPLEHGFQVDQNTYWAGFSRDVPVAESTLAYIILDGGSYQDCQSLETRCEQWTGRQIKVISLRDAEMHLRFVQGLEMGIPSEWPLEDSRMGQKILNTLLVRTGQMLQARVRQPMMMTF